jgi:hypothetical protein
MNSSIASPWIGDWAWGLPLIVVTVVIHVCGLALIGEQVVHRMSGSIGGRRSRFMPKFALVMGATSLQVSVLHGIEAAIWALAFRYLDALPDQKSAMLYSLSAITAYGHANLFLKERWQLMGALEALNGMLLFGLTTAFLFAMIQRVWPLGSRERHRDH